MDISFTVAGYLVGFIIGLTGVGGGSLMTPILVLGFSIPPAVAVGTDLLYAAITKASGIFVHQKHGTIDWRVVKLLGMGSIPATLIAVYLLKRLNVANVNYEPLITTLLSIALVLTSLTLFFRSPLQRLSQKSKKLPISPATMTVMSGFLIGILVTLSSVGAGALGAAILLFLYRRMPTISVVGTDLAHAVPVTAIAGLGHFYLGTVDFTLLASLLLGSIPGIYCGTHLGVRLPERIIQPILATMLIIIGIMLIIA